MEFAKCLARGYGSEPLVRYVAWLNDGLLAVKSEKSYREWRLDKQGDWIGCRLRMFMNITRRIVMS